LKFTTGTLINPVTLKDKYEKTLLQFVYNHLCLTNKSNKKIFKKLHKSARFVAALNKLMRVML